MDKNWIFNIGEYEKRIYSQKGQDGVIEYIFKNLRTKNDIPFCVEFGFNSDTLEGGTGSNVANLVLNNDWRCLLLDGDYESEKINLYKHHLTSDNICSIFSKYKVPKSPEYISIDVDSIDLWLFKAILSKYTPMVVSVEYNANFPIDEAITFIDLKTILNIKNSRRTYGASLKALKMVGDEFGYTLVYVLKGLDAFFIRNDLLKNYNIPSFDYFKDKIVKWHNRQKDQTHVKYFLDYEVYVETGGNIKESQEAAVKACHLYVFH